jgi:hypothetical protein
VITMVRSGKTILQLVLARPISHLRKEYTTQIGREH